MTAVAQAVAAIVGADTWDKRVNEVTPKQVEGLFSRDLAYLQRCYRQINESGDSHVPVQCPQCSTQFEVDFGNLGGLRASP